MIDRKLFTASPANDGPSSRPVFPLPRLDGQPPVLLLFDAADLTIAVAYERHHVPGGPLVRSATRETTRYCIPQPTLVLAAWPGVVIGTHKHGRHNHRVVVDHFGWLTVYSGLERVFRPLSSGPRGSPIEVGAGEPVGYLPASRAGPLRPLHFELWRAHRLHDYEQLDPIPTHASLATARMERRTALSSVERHLIR